MALAWGQPVEYIESLPMSTIAQFKALNIIRPFTNDALLHQNGLIASLIYNSNCAKKRDQKAPKELFPYLDRDTPDWLEDERVLKAKNLINSIQMHKADMNLYNSSFMHIKEKIEEEIDIIKNSDDPCEYTIQKLSELIGENNGEENV